MEFGGTLWNLVESTNFGGIDWMVESVEYLTEWWNLVELGGIWWNLRWLKGGTLWNLVEYLTEWWNLVESTDWWNLVESKVTEGWNLVEFGGTWWNLQILVESTEWWNLVEFLKSDWMVESGEIFDWMVESGGIWLNGGI